MIDLADWTHDELVAAYNATSRPNIYGAELLRRVHAADRDELGMSAENPRLLARR